MSCNKANCLVEIKIIISIIDLLQVPHLGGEFSIRNSDVSYSCVSTNIRSTVKLKKNKIINK